MLVDHVHAPVKKKCSVCRAELGLGLGHQEFTCRWCQRDSDSVEMWRSIAENLPPVPRREEVRDQSQSSQSSKKNYKGRKVALEARFIYYSLKPPLTLRRIVEYQQHLGCSAFRSVNSLEVTLHRLAQELQHHEKQRHEEHEQREVVDIEKIMTSLGRCLFRKRYHANKCGHNRDECLLRQYWLFIAEKFEDVS